MRRKKNSLKNLKKIKKCSNRIEPGNSMVWIQSSRKPYEWIFPRISHCQNGQWRQERKKQIQLQHYKCINHQFSYFTSPIFDMMKSFGKFFFLCSLLFHWLRLVPISYGNFQLNGHHKSKREEEENKNEISMNNSHSNKLT